MQHMIVEASGSPRSRWWAGLVVTALIIGGAVWFARSDHTERAEDAKPHTIPFAIRKEIKLGPDYRVAVTTVNLNAKKAIEQADPTNPAPKGQYVIATVTIKPIGGKVSNPAKDLVVTYAGSDSRIYTKATCHAKIAPPAPGSYAVCFDLPEPAISGGHVGVALSSSPNDPKYWEINN